MSSAILIVEDDRTIAAIMAGYLEAGGLHSDFASNGRELMRRLRTSTYALVLLDLGLPDEDGLTLLRKLRGRIDIPVMVVTARDSIDARLAAFELGAQDVLTKPFDPRELRYRVTNLLARTGKTQEAAREFALDAWRVCLDSRRVHSERSAASVSLTRTEFDLLVFFIRGGGRVYSRAQIIDVVNEVSDPDSDRAIDVLVSRLRRKLSTDGGCTDKRLETVRGVGYRLRLDAARPA